MTISTTKLYSTLFIIVIFLQLYLPSFKINIVIQLFFLIFFFIEKITATRYFLNIISPIILLFLLGFIGSIFNKFEIINFIKDITHFIKPILGLSVGYLFSKKINNFKNFIKSIVIVGFISAIIHFFILFFMSRIDTIAGIREFGKDNFLELFALFFLGFYNKFKKEELFSNRLLNRTIFYSLLLSCVFYFSRTMMIVALILFLSFHGYTLITRKTIKLLGVLSLSFVLFYVYLFSIKIDKNGQGIENFLYKIKIAPSEVFQSKIDRYDHNDLWDHWRGYESIRALDLMYDNSSSFIIGMGYGSLINLKFKAPLTSENNGMRYISELHNGYSYILYKTGIIGLFIYIYMLFQLYRSIYLEKKFTTIVISAIGIFFFFTTTTITGIYNSKDIVIFILGAMIFFKKNN